jgi:pimeloyl-ACP methyl ester carboxylesterase
VNEHILNFQVVGTGRPLVLIHGFGISFNIWMNLAPLLSQHFTLVMVELPGIGGSPMPEEGQNYLAAALEGIEAVREQLGIKKWDVLGYSSGSRIAEAYIQTYARHVACAVFVCPVEVYGLKPFAVHIGVTLDRSMPALGNWILSGWRLKFLISLLGFNLQPDPQCKEWYAQISAAPMRTLKETIRAVARAMEMPFSVPVPFALIWGDRDLVPTIPRRGGPRDYFVHGRHAALVDAAPEVARILLLMGNGNSVKNKHGASEAILASD